MYTFPCQKMATRNLSKTLLLALAVKAVVGLGLDINLSLGQRQGQELANAPHCESTTTIPYIGICTTWTTISPCGNHPATLVVQTPLATRTCDGPTHTPTTTTTTTTTTPIPQPTLGGPCPVVKPRCRASGLNVEYYSNPLGGYSRENSLPWSYYITSNLRPLQSSTTNVTFFPQDLGPPANLPKVYPRADLPGAYYAVGWTKQTNGGIVVDANNFTMVYTGFYRAPETGKYSLCTTADNENDVFFGHGNAFSCTDGKVDTGVKPLAVSTGGSYINGIKCVDLELVRDAYYPLRSVMGDWQGPSAFNLTMQRPSESFEERKNDFSGLAYPHECGLTF